MTPLYLLRHGPTDASRRGAPLGHLDLPVTAEADAAFPAVRAALDGLGLARVHASPLVRCARHAAALGLPVRWHPELREQAFGRWEGRPWDELTAAEPEATARFFADPVGAAPPGGEAFAALAARAVPALAEVVAGPGPALVLAHAGPLRALLGHLLGLPLDRALDLDWAPFGLTRVDVYGEGRGCLRWHNRILGAAAAATRPPADDGAQGVVPTTWA